jgi:transposase
MHRASRYRVNTGAPRPTASTLSYNGWLLGEREHCKMVAIPTIEDEDAKRPNRERENLVGEQTRIVNRMKAALSRLGIRTFNPKLKKAAERLGDLRTPEGEPIPPNTLAELRRDMKRIRGFEPHVRMCVWAVLCL